MAEINLSSAVRDNLLTLQNTADLLSKTQKTLATGNKVNSALDNPGSFFTASGLNARASDLSTLLDDQGQALQTIKAADEGISAITKLTESAKAKANQALQANSQTERKELAGQYNELLGQIEDLAKDASYKGQNLLGGEGNDLEVIFNEDNTSRLTIEAADFTDASLEDGLNLQRLDTGAESGTGSFSFSSSTASIDLSTAVGGGAATSNSTIVEDLGFTAGDVITLADDNTGNDVTFTVTDTSTVDDLVTALDDVDGVSASFDSTSGSEAINISANSVVSLAATGTTPPTTLDVAATTAEDVDGADALVESGSFNVGDSITLEDGNGAAFGSFEVTETSTVEDLAAFLNDQDGVTASADANGLISIEGGVDLKLTSDSSDFEKTALAGDTANGEVSALNVKDSGFATNEDINSTISSLNSALSTLRSQAGEFGTQLSTVEIRQDFTKSLINTLEEGAGKLTLADTNQEGANLLALQTRQQLSSTSLSFASQAEQQVLRLF